MAKGPILLIGGNGQVGWELRRALAPLGELVVWDRAACDLEAPEGLRRQVREVAPRAIVNAAAYTAVDRAESEPERAEAVNAVAPGVLAEEAKRSGGWLVQYSTDYVFDGSGERPWRETDPTVPASVYGHTKLDGERVVMASDAAALVFRVSWVYGVHGANFLKAMLKAAANREELRVVADQYGAPTPAHLIADVTTHALRDALAGRTAAEPGLYHVAPGGVTDWHAYAKYAIEHARTLGWPVIANTIEPIATADWPTPAARPANSRLDCGKLEATFGVRLPDWQSGVRRVTEQLIQEGLWQ